jgi:hypothetical protein
MTEPFDVTFETKCYEKDWNVLLLTNRLMNMISYNSFPFKEKILYINNVNDPVLVSEYAEKLVNQGIITSYVVVDDYANEALDYFGIMKESFRGGYYYSIAELVSIYLCKTEYLVHFSSDSILAKPFDWVTPAILKMNSNPSVKVANPVWNHSYDFARSESFAEDENFYYGYGFSDQCYLIKTSDFKANIYHEKNQASERYPHYGGELFEKRVDAFMRNRHFHRITYNKGSYIHQNF